MTVSDDDGGVASTTVAVTVVVGARSSTAWQAEANWPLDSIAVAGLEYTRDEALATMAASGAEDLSSSLFTGVVGALLNEASGADASCVEGTLAAS